MEEFVDIDLSTVGSGEKFNTYNDVKEARYEIIISNPREATKDNPIWRGLRLNDFVNKNGPITSKILKTHLLEFHDKRNGILFPVPLTTNFLYDEKGKKISDDAYVKAKKILSEHGLPNMLRLSEKVPHGTYFDKGVELPEYRLFGENKLQPTLHGHQQFYHDYVNKTPTGSNKGHWTVVYDDGVIYGVQGVKPTTVAELKARYSYTHNGATIVPTVFVTSTSNGSHNEKFMSEQAGWGTLDKRLRLLVAEPVNRKIPSVLVTMENGVQMPPELAREHEPNSLATQKLSLGLTEENKHVCINVRSRLYPNTWKPIEDLQREEPHHVAHLLEQNGMFRGRWVHHPENLRGDINDKLERRAQFDKYDDDKLLRVLYQGVLIPSDNEKLRNAIDGIPINQREKAIPQTCLMAATIGANEGRNGVQNNLAAEANDKALHPSIQKEVWQLYTGNNEPRLSADAGLKAVSGPDLLSRGAGNNQGGFKQESRADGVKTERSCDGDAEMTPPSPRGFKRERSRSSSSLEL